MPFRKQTLHNLVFFHPRVLTEVVVCFFCANRLLFSRFIHDMFSPICFCLCLVSLGIKVVFRLRHALTVSVRKIARTVHSLRLADLESPSGNEMRRVFLSQRSALTSDLHEAYTCRAKQSQEIREGINFLFSDPSFRLRWTASAPLSLWMKVWMGGQAAASQPQHQHPQADHVGTHVPENADASSHRPGWALRWSCRRTERHICDRLGETAT